MTKCSASIAIMEMQIRVTLRFYSTPVRMAERHTPEDADKGKPLHAAGADVN